MIMHSAPTVIVLLAICITYYKRRTALEAAVLRSAFGKQYDAWASKTKRFVPFVW